MKKLLLSVLVLAASVSQAKVEVLECGLPDFMETDGAIIELAGGKTLEEGVELTPLQKQQVVIAARALLGDADDVDAAQINSATEAIRLLQNWGTDVYIENFRVAGRDQVFTYVKGYPGDNPYGVIFAGGSRTIIAYSQDSSVSCAK